MSPDTWFLLSLTLLSAAASPGPSLALVTQIALSAGRASALAFALAHGVGIGLYALAVVLGLGGLIQNVTGAMPILAPAGAIFLCVIGAMMLRSGVRGLTRNAAGAEDERVSTLDPGSHRDSVGWAIVNGFLIVFLNPKVALFFLAVFSQFLAPTQSLGTHLFAASLAALIDVLWYASLAVLLTIPRVSARALRLTAPLDITFGSALLIFGVVLLLR